MAKIKKYALNNSYFKNRYGDMPKTPLEIVRYYKEKGELPFEYTGSNWVYDMFCEYHKRNSVQNEQFLTPDKTAWNLVKWLIFYSQTGQEYYNYPFKTLLEIGCGTGQITKLLPLFKSITAIDIDTNMIEICKLTINTELYNFVQDDYNTHTGEYDYIIANPPYSKIDSVLNCVHRNLVQDGIAVLLLSAGTMEKERPKALVELINKFKVLHKERMTEKFERTGTCADIYVIQRIV